MVAATFAEVIARKCDVIPDQSATAAPLNLKLLDLLRHLMTKGKKDEYRRIYVFSIYLVLM